jgi:hypothetical protein
VGSVSGVGALIIWRRRTEPEKNSRFWAGVREEVGVVMSKRSTAQCGERWVDGLTVYGVVSVINPCYVM